MSVKYIWWTHAKNMISAYPVRSEQYHDLIDMQKIPNNDGMPHGTGVTNPVEALMISAEENTAYREYWAVRKALALFDHYGEAFTQFVVLYYWTRPSLRLERIAPRIHVSKDTVFRWNRLLIKAVGREMGWL